MIHIIKEHYCEECPRFKAVSETNSFFAGDMKYVTDTCIRCEHESECAEMYKYLLSFRLKELEHIERMKDNVGMKGDNNAST